MKQNKKRKVIVIALLTAAVVMGGGIFTKNVLSSRRKKNSAQVLSCEVTTGSVDSTVSATGNITMDTSTDIVSSTGVIVKEVLVETGDEVKKGDVLARLDKTSVVSELIEAKDTKEDLEDQLDDDDLSSLEIEKIEGEIEEIKDRIEDLNALHENPVIKSTVSGIITTVNVSVGSEITQTATNAGGTTSDDSSTTGSTDTGLVYTSYATTGTTEGSATTVATATSLPLASPLSTIQYQSGNTAISSKSSVIRLSSDESGAGNDKAEGSGDSGDSGESQHVSQDADSGSDSDKDESDISKEKDSDNKDTGGTSGNTDSKDSADNQGNSGDSSNDSSANNGNNNSSSNNSSNSNNSTSNSSSNSTNNNANTNSNSSTASNYSNSNSSTASNSSNSNKSTKNTATKNNTDSSSTTNNQNVPQTSQNKSFSKSSGGGSASSSSSSAGSSSETTEFYGTYRAAAFVVSTRKAIKIIVSIDELDILSVEKGQTAKVTLDALEDQEFEGTITKISPTASTSNGNTKYDVEVTIPDNDQIMDGMSASVVIVTDSTDNAVVIPVLALQEKGEKKFVYTSKDADGNLSGEVEVETGLSDGTNVAVTKGLSEGQTVYYQIVGSDDKNSFQNMPVGPGGGAMNGAPGGGPHSGSGGNGFPGGGGR